MQSWLGDAMEGPTPVSALIHAATMVTAGVYLIVRSGPVFDLAPDARLGVVIVGAVTLLFGAIIGCAKDDIKKALAASTMSQIGYMVLAAGLGPAGYAIAIMHLLTHGFFKAGLFLGAGSVMHGMNDETDMRRYGGLRKYMPITFATFGLGYLAIIGVPPFAGFFSKDAIIETAFAAGGVRGLLLGGAALLGAGITAFYMTRVMLMTFFGEKRWKPDAHPHESPGMMTWPMIVLAIGSVGAGACWPSAARWSTGSNRSSAHTKCTRDSGMGDDGHHACGRRGRRRHRLPDVREMRAVLRRDDAGRQATWCWSARAAPSAGPLGGEVGGARRPAAGRRGAGRDDHARLGRTRFRSPAMTSSATMHEAAEVMNWQHPSCHGGEPNGSPDSPGLPGAVDPPPPRTRPGRPSRSAPHADRATTRGPVRTPPAPRCRRRPPPATRSRPAPQPADPAEQDHPEVGRSRTSERHVGGELGQGGVADAVDVEQLVDRR